MNDYTFNPDFDLFCIFVLGCFMQILDKLFSFVPIGLIFCVANDTYIHTNTFAKLCILNNRIKFLHKDYDQDACSMTGLKVNFMGMLNESSVNR